MRKATSLSFKGLGGNCEKVYLNLLFRLYRGSCFLREVFLKPFNKLAGHVLSGLKPNKTPWPAESFIKRYMYLELCHDLKSHWVLMHCIYLSSLLYNAKLIIKISPNGVCVRRI